MRSHYGEQRFDLGSSGIAPLPVSEMLSSGDLQDLLTVHLCDGEPTGSAELRSEVAAEWGTAQPERVLITHGSSEALFLSFGAILESGDTVVVQEPGYHVFRGLARFFGCRVSEWHMPLDGGRPDLSRLHQLLSTHPKLVALNFPHNPTGIAITRDELAEILYAVDRVGAHLVWDGAFADLTYDEALYPRITARDLAVERRDLCRNTFEGVRISWAPCRVVHRERGTH